jgi:hypothetical protein
MRIVNASFGPTRIGECEREDGSARLQARLRRLDLALDSRRSEGEHRAAFYADKRRSYPRGADRPQGGDVFRV